MQIHKTPKGNKYTVDRDSVKLVTGRGNLGPNGPATAIAITLFLLMYSVVEDPGYWFLFPLFMIFIWFICALVTCAFMTDCPGPHYCWKHDPKTKTTGPTPNIIMGSYLQHDKYKEALHDYIDRIQTTGGGGQKERDYWYDTFTKLNKAMASNLDIKAAMAQEALAQTDYASAIEVENENLKKGITGN